MAHLRSWPFLALPVLLIDETIHPHFKSIHYHLIRELVVLLLLIMDFPFIVVLEHRLPQEWILVRAIGMLFYLSFVLLSKVVWVVVGARLQSDLELAFDGVLEGIQFS